MNDINQLIYRFFFFTSMLSGSVSCQHGVACPQVTYGGGSLQMWKVIAGNVRVVSKQSQTSGHEANSPQ